MADESKRSEMLGVALKLEREGMEFYRQASEKMADELASRMFLSLVEDEKKHACLLKQMAAEAGVEPAEANVLRENPAAQQVSALFKETARRVREDVGPDDDQIKVIEVAKDMELRAFNFYARLQEEITDDLEKVIVAKIAEQENEHYRILDDTQLYLTNQAEWNIKEEKPLIDGG